MLDEENCLTEFLILDQSRQTLFFFPTSLFPTSCLLVNLPYLSLSLLNVLFFSFTYRLFSDFDCTEYVLSDKRKNILLGLSIPIFDPPSFAPDTLSLFGERLEIKYSKHTGVKIFRSYVLSKIFCAVSESNYKV